VKGFESFFPFLCSFLSFFLTFFLVITSRADEMGATNTHPPPFSLVFFTKPQIIIPSLTETKQNDAAATKAETEVSNGIPRGKREMRKLSVQSEASCAASSGGTGAVLSLLG
jgi:hypothetical protein